jgi:hypothetical protein
MLKSGDVSVTNQPAASEQFASSEAHQLSEPLQCSEERVPTELAASGIFQSGDVSVTNQPAVSAIAGSRGIRATDDVLSATIESSQSIQNTKSFVGPRPIFPLSCTVARMQSEPFRLLHNPVNDPKVCLCELQD